MHESSHSVTRIAINGFGRIGRLAARIILTQYPELDIVAVNDLTSAEDLAYLLAHDTTYRSFQYDVTSREDYLEIITPQGVKQIKVLAQKNPSELPWKDLGIDVVLECTGLFLTEELAQLHIQAGAKQVILSAPAKTEGIPTIVLGVNDTMHNLSAQIISNASCTTNCVSPDLDVMLKNFGIKQVMGVTIHAYTATQVLQDGPSKKDFRDGRAAAQNLIPSKTGAAKAVIQVLPELKDKLNLSSLRVPVLTGSVVYLNIEMDRNDVTVDQINQAFQDSSQTDKQGILEYSRQDLVSSDIISNSHSSIVDGQLTEVLGNTAKIVVWYDNEWGYANRLVEIAKKTLM